MCSTARRVGDPPRHSDKPVRSHEPDITLEDIIMNTLTTTGARAIFALPFAIFGLMHFLNASQMASYVPIPGGVFWVYVTGVALVAGSIAILVNKHGVIASFGLAALMLSFIVTMHAPGLLDEATRQMAMPNLLKDTSLMGGALAYAGILDRAEVS